MHNSMNIKHMTQTPNKTGQFLYKSLPGLTSTKEDYQGGSKKFPCHPVT